MNGVGVDEAVDTLGHDGDRDDRDHRGVAEGGENRPPVVSEGDTTGCVGAWPSGRLASPPIHATGSGSSSFAEPDVGALERIIQQRRIMFDQWTKLL